MTEQDRQLKLKNERKIAQEKLRRAKISPLKKQRARRQAKKTTKLSRQANVFAEAKPATKTKRQSKLNLKSGRKAPQDRSYHYSRALVEREIIGQAHALNLPEGWAKLLAKRTADYIDEWIKNKPMVTRRDLNLAIAEKLEESNLDIAYAYKNNDKII